MTSGHSITTEPKREVIRTAGMARSAFALPLTGLAVMGIRFRTAVPLCPKFLYVKEDGPMHSELRTARVGLCRHPRAERKKALFLCLNGRI